MEVIEKIRTLRELKSMSQEELADKIFMSREGYAKIERGERGLDVQRLNQIADALDISVSDLLNITDKSELYLVNDSGQLFVSKGNSQYNYNFHGDKELQNENEKLRLQLQHKEELLKQKAMENQLLKELVESLKINK